MIATRLRIQLSPKIEKLSEGLTAEECEKAANEARMVWKQLRMKAWILRIDSGYLRVKVATRWGKRWDWAPRPDHDGE